MTTREKMIKAAIKKYLGDCLIDEEFALDRPFTEGEDFFVEECNIAPSKDLTLGGYLRLSFNPTWDNADMICIFKKSNCNEAKIEWCGYIIP